MTADWRPSLGWALELRHDAVRDTDLLLMPERIVVLRGAAAAVLRLCDGSRTVSRIIEELSAEYPGAPVADDVHEFLHRVRQEGWLR
ncbi:pyrroloquinoline quinone biosynthesis peptide chaperone PqqD [Sphaerisporangium fuscum]|uniref:pyrroloquinoline quinone biosynthesis peptide chaperone PqqD n=1 Tax=Sphaerisporangium fuscum TaxID=2835868 RepID=UPI001BDDC3DB|nr:pyrroloquinoline quinone biosynthesis peptide chaperone PqqD [Sphaerisporangium fuscum]